MKLPQSHIKAMKLIARSETDKCSPAIMQMLLDLKLPRDLVRLENDKAVLTGKGKILVEYL